MEGVPLEDSVRVLTMVRTGYNPLWIVGGLVTGPLYGYLGHRWRVARSWISAALVTFALCLEPLARGIVGMRTPHPFVWWVEVATGVVVGVSSVVVIVASRRAREAVPPPSSAA